MVSSTEVIRLLEANGFTLARVKGSHHHFKKNGHPNIVTVPHPRKDLPRGTLRAIEKASGVELT